MTIRIIINGANGKMGRCACDYLPTQNDIKLVAKASRGDDLIALVNQHQADVVIDLTNANSAMANTTAILESGARAVIGTSGFSQADIDQLQQTTEKLQRGCIIAPNFSIGAVLMMEFTKKAARYIPNVEIIEAHHEHKLDAPSGTSIKTAQLIESVRKQYDVTPVSDATKKIDYEGARGGLCHGVPIHSLRMPGVLANQEVVFGSTGETFSLSHVSIDRSAFMPGIAMACRQVMQLNKLVYGLENLLV